MGGHQPWMSKRRVPRTAAAGLRAVEVLARERPPFLSFTPQAWGNGHPTQQFSYQPALERTLRAGVAATNVEVLLGHECTGLDQDVGHPGR